VLICYAVDDECSPLDSVLAPRVLPTIAVAELRDIIHAQKHKFAHIERSQLALWKLLEPLSIEDNNTLSVNTLLEAFRSNPESVAQRLHPALPVSGITLRKNHLSGTCT
jgi:hypothetical protein